MFLKIDIKIKNEKNKKYKIIATIPCYNNNILSRSEMVVKSTEKCCSILRIFEVVIF